MNKIIILFLLLYELPIVAGSDGNYCIQMTNDENITHIVAEGNDQLQVPQTILDQFLDFAAGEDGSVVFCVGLAAFAGILYVIENLTRDK